MEAVVDISLIPFLSIITTELQFIPEVRTERCPSECDCFPDVM